MCGISAIYAYAPDAGPVSFWELQRMQQRQGSRGPDGRNDWSSSDGRIALAHNRLAILDLSDRGAQPMWTPDGQVGIVHNGEIYNVRDLRRGLEDRGKVFRSGSDAEVLLYLYEDKGERMVDDLRGMFAFVVCDLRRNELLLARDPFGIKPLYYADDGSTIRIASQVRALREAKISTALDPAAAVGFFLTGSVPEPFTIHASIRALPAGNVMRVSREGAGEPQRYFSVAMVFRNAAGGPRLPEMEQRRIVADELRESVGYHLVADVPVGLFLSSGIDSTVVATLAREIMPEQQRLHALTLAFEEYLGAPENEAPLAAETARALRLAHDVRFVGYEDLSEDLPKFFAAMDQPTIDGLNVWFVAKAARELGWKAALSGLGGDELFGGYPSFTEIPRLVRWMKVPSRIPIVRSIYEALVRSRDIARRKPKTTGLVRYGGSWAGAWFLRRGLFLPWELESILGAERTEEGLARLNLLERIEATITPDPHDGFARVAAMESSLYLRNQLLRDADWAAMAHSVEVRFPFVDAWLLDRIAPVLLRCKAPRKRLLFDAVRPPVPASRLDTKIGFTLPIVEWNRRLEQEEGSAPFDPGEPPSMGLTMRRWARRVFEAVVSSEL